MTVTITAPAKINLFLHVLARNPDGYHEIQTLVDFISIGDELSIAQNSSPEFEFHLSGDFAQALATSCPNYKDNLIYKAFLIFKEHFGITTPIKLQLVKNLPIYSGLASGSTDAAALALGLCELFNINKDIDELSKIYTNLGADMAMCLHKTSLIATGTGEQINPNIKLPKLNILLVNPMIKLSTPEIYQSLSSEYYHNQIDIQQLYSHCQTAQELCNFLRNNTINTLEKHVIKHNQTINNLLTQIDQQPNCMLARMSGSGATCFGIFPTKQDLQKAAKAVKSKYSGFWVKDII